jgi:hypothetical protein
LLLGPTAKVGGFQFEHRSALGRWWRYR